MLGIVHGFYVVYLPQPPPFSQIRQVDNDKNYPTESLDQLSYPPTCSVAFYRCPTHQDHAYR